MDQPSLLDQDERVAADPVIPDLAHVAALQKNPLAEETYADD